MHDRMTTTGAPSSAPKSDHDQDEGHEDPPKREEEEEEEDEEVRLQRAVRSRDRDAVRSILAARGARQRTRLRERGDCVGASAAGEGSGGDAEGVEAMTGACDGRDRELALAPDRRSSGEGRCEDGDSHIGNGRSAGLGRGSTPPGLTADEAATPSSSPFDPSDFACPICRRLLHKPCVNSCGHAFCFWCLHRAMNALGDSSCPTCRNPFRQFARPLGPLHRFLTRAFPDETERRAEETEREEEELFGGTRSPTVALEAPPLPGGAGAEDEEKRASFFVAHGRCVDAVDLLCVSCRCVVVDPVVPGCGHLACRGCVSVKLPVRRRRRSGSGSGSGEDDVPPVSISATSDSTSTPVEEEEVPSEGDLGNETTATYECPRCGIPVLDGVGGRSGELGRCAALSPLLDEIGDDVRGQLREMAALSTAAAAADVTTDVGEDGGGVTAASVSLSPAPLRQPPPPPPPGSRDDYVHHGVGCDGCGTFPIVGRAYHCTDCPESIGYDVCHDCYAVRGVHLTEGGSGRFDQSSHGPTHRMEEREQVVTILHALADMRPDLTHGQLMQLLEMHMDFVDAEAEEDEEDDDDNVGGNDESMS